MVKNRDKLSNGYSEDQKEIKTIGEIDAENDITNVEEQGRYFAEFPDKDTYIEMNLNS
ncbi:MAG: hypothetical protein K0R28_2146 [Paenibacillus sp.]|nr:hypothetical protein [Paenibacillus sp.]